MSEARLAFAWPCGGDLFLRIALCSERDRHAQRKREDCEDDPFSRGASYGHCVGRLVGEVRAQPALGLRERDAFALRVVLDLLAVNTADREIARFRVSDVDSR